MSEHLKQKKHTIRKFCFSTLPIEVLALQQRFEAMSAKGFMVTGRSGFFHKYEACEPKERRFHVEYFYKASFYDTHPEMDTEDFIDYCEAAGWHHCYCDGKMQCFYTEDQDVPPIETDDSFRLKSIVKAGLIQRSTMLFLGILYMVIGIMNLQRYMTDSRAWLWFITSQTSVSLVVFNMLFFTFALISMFDLLYFYRMNRKRLMEGLTLHLYDLRTVRLRRMCRKISIVVLITVLISGAIQDPVMLTVMSFFLVLALILIMGYDIYAKKSNLSRKDNMGMSVGLGLGLAWILIMVTVGGLMVHIAATSGVDVDLESHSIRFYGQDQIPITLSHLGYLPNDESLRFEETSFEKQSSFLASLTEYANSYVDDKGFNPNLKEGNSSPFFNVTVLDSHYEWVVERYVDNYSGEDGVGPISKDDYSLLFLKGYRGYFKEDINRRNVVVVEPKRAVIVTSHGDMSEEVILKLLQATE